MKTLDKKIASGIGWTTISTLGNQGLRLLIKLVLARLLLPEDYGLIGMATVFIGFVDVISELGMGAALIQRKQQKLSSIHFNTAFWTSLGIAAAGYVIITLIIAPSAAWFYEKDILIKLIPVLAIPIVTNTFFLIPKIKLSRELNFKPQAIAEITSVVIAGIAAVILAWRGFGVWALAFNGIITSLTSILLYHIFYRWTPSLIFSKEAFQELFNFGGYVMLQRIFNYLTSNIDYILIGKLIGSSALGVYTLSFILTDTFRSQIMNMLNKVLFPAYSSIQDNVKKLGQYYLRIVKINGLLLIPIMTFYIVLARPIIVLGFGEEWENAVIPLQILSLGVIIHAISGTVTTVLKSLGHAKLIVKVNIINNLLIAVPAIAVGAHFYGINGAAIGILIFKITGLVIYQRYIDRYLNVSFSQLLGQVMWPLMVSVGLGAVIFATNRILDLSIIIELVVGTIVILAGYSAYLFTIEKSFILQIKGMLSKK
uniref:Lipopolysaccharide biosynthesis protein n=1 Tax=Roseihalotalea indica TaxID=2867963 RepID=A0AA49GIA7_9BACT|nr:lipopolysaccharide biosynthesis protein [Tunicatimonas sp. TK19036]